MIEHNNRWQRIEKIPPFFKVSRFETNHNVPDKCCNLVNYLAIMCIGFRIDQAFDKIEPHAAHTGFVHDREFCVGDVGPDFGYTARFAVRMDKRIDHRVVVGSVASCLHHYIACKAKMTAQGV